MDLENERSWLFGSLLIRLAIISCAHEVGPCQTEIKGDERVDSEGPARPRKMIFKAIKLLSNLKSMYILKIAGFKMQIAALFDSNRSFGVDASKCIARVARVSLPRMYAAAKRLVFPLMGDQMQFLRFEQIHFLECPHAQLQALNFQGLVEVHSVQHGSRLLN